MLRIGLDIGGTKTELVALADGGVEFLRRRSPTPHRSYEDAVAGLAAMVGEAEAEIAARASIGVGLPGRVNPDSGLVENAFNTVYNGRPLKGDLERRLGREVRIENDASCFALSETLDGAARGARVVFGAILGTGAGGGIVVDGRMLAGANGVAGEWGHNPLPWPEADELPGPLCYCGRRGCIEQFVSGPGLAADHERTEGEKLAPAEIARRAGSGEHACLRTLERWQQRLARAFAHVIHLLDPDVIVVGGGLSAIGQVYDEVPKALPALVYGGKARTRIVRAARGDASGVRGAAMLWDPPHG